VSSALCIRNAESADAALILDLIRELSEYEKLAHEVEANEDLIRETLFGPHPAAEVVIAELEGEVVGFALFFSTYSTFLARPGIWLEDLYVRPEARGRGAGTRLLAHLADLAQERGCGRLEWTVLDWNESAIGFYRALGAVAMDEWTTFRMTGASLRRLADRARG